MNINGETLEKRGRCQPILMKLTGDDVLKEGRKNLKFQVKIPKIAYSTGVLNFAHFLPPGAGFKFQNAN
jgi:hypothetical protein